jgi:two-component system nitrogen regulation sensor histidine kinase GlnL
MTTYPTNEDVIENMAEAVIAIGPSDEMVVAIFNQGAERITEMSRDKVSGSALRESFSRDPWLVELAEKTLKDGKLYSEYEGTLHRWFSNPIPVGVSTNRIFSISGEVSGVAIIIKDLSGIKAIEAETTRKDRLAYLGTFAAKLAHEVRNPLSGIRGAAQLVDRKINDPEIKEFSTLIISEVDRLAIIVKEMLNFTRPAKLITEPINIHRLLDQVMLLLSEGEGTLSVTKEYDPSLPEIKGDANQLTQVFLNLLKNAMEASTDESEILVSTKMATDFHLTKEGSVGNKFALIEIKDSGVGIEAEDIEQIFTPFYTTKDSGSGLGMSISLSIIKDHGGFMKVNSKPGEGTTMLVYIPTIKEKRDKI